MSHPIHQANENSPYGDLTREDFYNKHQVLHHQTFILNKQNTKLFTQTWRPQPGLNSKPKGLVAMVHGYTSESSWLFELTAVAIAKAGFIVKSFDLQGHGYSGGSPLLIPKIEPVVQDCIQVFDSAQADYPELPAFLYGESLGGAIAILIALKQKNQWKGLIVSGAMCGVSKKYKPVWPLEKLLPPVACVAPNWQIVIMKSPDSKSYKEEWKRKLVEKSPNRQACGKPPAATALEFLRVCKYITRNCNELEVPFLVLHGGDDKVCDPKLAKLVYESAGSEDKCLKIFAGMWHQWIGEPNEGVDRVFGTMMAWIGERVDKANTNLKC